MKLATSFYDATLETIGLRRVFENSSEVGYGFVAGQDLLCLKLRPDATAPGPGFHLAFTAPSRAAVDAFYMCALKHGGADNGSPGLRPDYGPTYYAAFVIDPDGYRIETVIDSTAV